MRHRNRDRQLPAIADDNAPLPPAHAPTRWTVRRGRAISRVLLGLALAAGLLSVYFTYQVAQESAVQAKRSAAQAEAVNRRLSVLEEDLAERTRQRDAERDAAAARAAQDREQFRVRFCEVLGELSATFPNLDAVEAALGCATTTPAAAVEVTPSSQQPPDAPAPATAAQDPGPPAPPPTASPQPDPAPSSPPPDDPGPVCTLLPLLC